MVRHKVTFFLVLGALFFWLAVVVYALPAIGPAGAPAHQLSGASLPVTGPQATRVALPAPALNSPVHQPSRMGPADWGRETWTAASLAAERKTSLRQPPTSEQPFQWGWYVNDTGPIDVASIFGLGLAAVRAKAGTLFLGWVMLLAILAVAARRAERAEETPNRVDAPQGSARSFARLLAEPGNSPRGRPDPRMITMGDQIAEWERVRLVPT